MRSTSGQDMELMMCSNRLYRKLLFHCVRIGLKSPNKLSVNVLSFSSVCSVLLDCGTEVDSFSNVCIIVPLLSFYEVEANGVCAVLQRSRHSWWPGLNRGGEECFDRQHQQATHSTGCQNQSRSISPLFVWSMECFCISHLVFWVWSNMLCFMFCLPADIEVACYGYEGIDAVKEALRAGLGCSTEAMPIKVKVLTQLLSATGEAIPLSSLSWLWFVFMIFNKRIPILERTQQLKLQYAT